MFVAVCPRGPPGYGFCCLSISRQRKIVKQVKITIHGTFTYSAHRTFEIEVSDDAPLQLFDLNTLEELAELDRVPWTIGECGYFEAADFSIDSVTDVNEDSTEPLATETQG